MANMRIVNQYIKSNFPKLEIEAVRGEGYVHFTGADGFDKIESIYCHPVSTKTDDMVDFVLQQIADAHPKA